MPVFINGSAMERVGSFKFLNFFDVEREVVVLAPLNNIGIVSKFVGDIGAVLTLGVKRIEWG